MRRYFRNVTRGPRDGVWTGPWSRRSAGFMAVAPRATGDGGARASGGLMGLAALLEDEGDELLERRVLHAHVGHGVAVEDRTQDLRHAGAVDLQVGRGALATGHLAVAVE